MGARDLIAKLDALDGPSNEIDILVEIACFEPDDTYASIRANSAGTKVIYAAHDGTNRTFWAEDHTLTPERRARCISALKALEARDG